jgi:hypothetical protein
MDGQCGYKDDLLLLEDYFQKGKATVHSIA